MRGVGSGFLGSVVACVVLRVVSPVRRVRDLEVVMVPAKGGIRGMLFSTLLCTGGKRSCGTALRVRAPLPAGSNSREGSYTINTRQRVSFFALHPSPLSTNLRSSASNCPPAVHRAVRTRALCSAAEALAEPVQDIHVLPKQAVSSRKAVVVARGKARLFW